MGRWKMSCPRGPWSLRRNSVPRRDTALRQGRHGKQTPDAPCLSISGLMPPPCRIQLAREPRNPTIRSQHPWAQTRTKRARNGFEETTGKKPTYWILGGKKKKKKKSLGVSDAQWGIRPMCWMRHPHQLSLQVFPLPERRGLHSIPVPQSLGRAAHCSLSPGHQGMGKMVSRKDPGRINQLDLGSR